MYLPNPCHPSPKSYELWIPLLSHRLTCVCNDIINMVGHIVKGNLKEIYSKNRDSTHLLFFYSPAQTTMKRETSVSDLQ